MRATGGGPATVEVLTPAEDLAASTLAPEAIEGFGGVEVGGVAGNKNYFQFRLWLSSLNVQMSNGLSFKIRR